MKKNILWEEFRRFSIDEKITFFKQKNIFHVLFAEQFHRKALDEIFQLANKIRQIAKSNRGNEFLASLLAHKRAMLYFIQPSTRTFLSFSSACHILGLQSFDVRSSETSSEMKGESFEDTIRTFSSYFDIIIMRHPEAFSSERGAWALNQGDRPIPIINAGSGKEQHPTQALLDVYTLRKSFEKEGDFKNKTVAMVGDLKRGRTIRSLSYILTEFENIEQIFVSPESYKIEDDIKNYLSTKKIAFTETTNFTQAIKKSDAVYMTRLQSEYEFEEGRKQAPPYDIEDYCFKVKHLSSLKPHSVILHPLPRRSEIEMGVDQDKRAIYWRQVRNGMWTRAALMVKIFNLTDKVLNY